MLRPIVLIVVGRLLKHGMDEEGPEAGGILKQSWFVGRSVGSVLGGFAQGFRLRASMHEEND